MASGNVVVQPDRIPDHKVVSVHLAIVEPLLPLPSRLEMVTSKAPDGWKGFSQLHVQSTGPPLRPVVINKKVVVREPHVIAVN